MAIVSRLHVDIASVDQASLEEEIALIWDRAVKDGLVPDDVVGPDGACPYRVDAEDQGVGLAEGFLIYVAAPVAVGVVLDLWREFVLPRLKAKFGEDSIGEEDED